MSLRMIAGIFLKNKSAHLGNNGYELASGKSMADVACAAENALKNGATLNDSIALLESYLKDILQPVVLEPISNKLPQFQPVAKSEIHDRMTERECSFSDAEESLNAERNQSFAEDLIQYVDAATQMSQIKDVLKILIGKM